MRDSGKCKSFAVKQADSTSMRNDEFLIDSAVISFKGCQTEDAIHLFVSFVTNRGWEIGYWIIQRSLFLVHLSIYSFVI